MASGSDIQGLAQWIRTAIQSPQPLDDHIMTFALATFGSNDPAHIIDQWDGSETSSLLDLMFYPDFPRQQHYERRWGVTPFSRDDQRAVIELMETVSLTAIRTLPESASTFTIDVPNWIPEHFVQRLHITWQPLPPLNQALDQLTSDTQRIDTRVHLRNAALTWHDHQAKLTGDFIAKMPWPSADYTPCLQFLLAILAEFEPHQKPRDFLTAKKAYFFRSLCNAEAFEQRRLSDNMETLMLKGLRATQGNPGEWRRRMRKIDAILMALFGETRYFSQPCDIQTTIRRSGKP